MFDPRRLVGYDSSDDACVYSVSDDVAVIETVDFFTPIVDDPYLFGQIAAANALSDVYAMGGVPKLAMNLLCVPSCLPLDTCLLYTSVFAIVGDVGDDAYGAYDAGVSAIFSINRLAVPRDEAKARSHIVYTHTLDDLLRCIRAAEQFKR